ncbi:Hypothetical_protein [Hexamita inflata]|uniref:Hypothetical_protein n=1 Tax=Hexamita inflata TaxID=28002 RepID=A0AA86NGR9_9EUKA|nr:Hypothetical protein HINF_LOCUS6396 [Hexamita inflata]CAI9928012.1 Hypothetical protein HINF_LOCUS15657 [Hexamita inflata]CAI9930083.1 Hypothetical protein HINF_LOCUS17728 [Hexamita inflata]
MNSQVLIKIQKKLEVAINNNEPLSYTELQEIHKQTMNILMLSAGHDMQQLYQTDEMFRKTGTIIDMAPQTMPMSDDEFFKAPDIKIPDVPTKDLKCSAMNSKALVKLNEAELRYVLMIIRLQKDVEALLTEMTDRIKTSQ